MKALKLYGIQDLRYEEAPKPIIENSTDVIIKVKAVGICGSDLSRYKKLGPYVEGMIWGHEFSGVVEEVGSEVTHVKIGQKVVGCPSIVCNKCEYCLSGEYAQCIELSTIGAYQPGAYAEYIKLSSESVVPVSEEVEYEEAAMIEPSCVVLHGFYKSNVKPGAEVAIVGCGNIGLLAIQWAKIFGAKRIFAIDVDDKKLDMAKEAGADVVINALQELPHKQLQNWTEGVDVAFESAGSPITSKQILALPKKGGQVVYLGIPYADVPMERFYFEKIVRNELVVRGSWVCISGPFPGKEWMTSAHHVKTKDLNLSPFITHRLKLSEGPEIFKRIIEGKESFGKVMFFPEWDNE